MFKRLSASFLGIAAFTQCQSFPFANNRQSVYCEGNSQSSKEWPQLKEMSDRVKSAFSATLASSGNSRLYCHGIGVRKVTWFHFHTYAMGVYKNPTSNDVILRLVPTRSSNGSHLKNAFTRLLLAQPSPDVDVVTEFGSWFPTGNLMEGQPMDIHCSLNSDDTTSVTMTTVNDRVLGTVKSKWLNATLLTLYSVTKICKPELIAGLGEQVQNFTVPKE